jgi:hypothetical protein
MITDKQRNFIDNYEGSCKGRYHITYLTILGIAGGQEIKEKAVEKFCSEKYLPDKMYPLSEASNIVIFGMENGVPAERMGKMVAQSYKRAAPDMFKDLTHDKVVDMLILAYSDETDVGNMLAVDYREPGKVLFSRKDSAMPCEFFVGVIKGGFEIVDLKAEVSEIDCQWKDDSHKCVFEIVW